MSTPQKFSIQKVFNLALQNPTDNSLVAYLTDLKTSGLENTVELVYPTGGDGNTYVGAAHAHSRRATMNVSSATYNTEVLAVQIGNDIVIGSNTNTTKVEVLTVSSDSATTTFTALGTTDAEIGTIYELNTYGDVVAEYSQVASPAATGEFSYDSGTKAISFFAGDLADNTKVRVLYTFDSGSTAQTITVSADGAPNTVDVTADAIVQRPCDGQVFQAQIKGRAQISGNFMLDVAADGDVASQDFTLEFIKACGNNTLYELIVYAEDDAS